VQHDLTGNNQQDLRKTITSPEMGSRPLRLAYVGLGSNLEHPVRQILAAFEALGALPDTRIKARSSLYRTAPLGRLDQPDFVNAVALLQTGLGARELLDGLLAIEERHGRRRSTPNAPRTLDLDLLLLGDEVLSQPGLEVPHPRMHERAFVLLPLSEIDPGAVVPGRGPVADLLQNVPDQPVTRIEADADD
jgi:2-amino-4-hydroxy-6-hydroxymethyldihydropteridine diphosphokinase